MNKKSRWNIWYIHILKHCIAFDKIYCEVRDECGDGILMMIYNERWFSVRCCREYKKPKREKGTRKRKQNHHQFFLPLCARNTTTMCYHFTGSMIHCFLRCSFRTHKETFCTLTWVYLMVSHIYKTDIRMSIEFEEWYDQDFRIQF